MKNTNMIKEGCEHLCTGNCRREGCNCQCGEWHDTYEEEVTPTKTYKYTTEDQEQKWGDMGRREEANEY